MSRRCQWRCARNHLALALQLGRDFRKRCGVGEIGVDCALGEWLGGSIIGRANPSVPCKQGDSTMHLRYDFDVAIESRLCTVERELSRSIRGVDVLLMRLQ
jgi:hypothetical protein